MKKLITIELSLHSWEYLIDSMFQKAEDIDDKALAAIANAVDMQIRLKQSR